MRNSIISNNINNKIKKALANVQTGSSVKVDSVPMFTAKLLGDSITNQNNVSTSYSTRGYFRWMNALLGQAFTEIGNFGVSGQRSDEVLARVDKDIINTNKPAWTFVLVGVNDISQLVAKNSTATKTFNNIKQIYTKLTDANIRVVAMTVPPSSSWTLDSQKQMWFELNRMIKNYARNNPNIILVDIGSVYLDPDNVAPITGMTLTDGTHPSSAGAYRMGKMMADTLKSHVFIQPTELTYSNIDSFNLIKNPTFSGTTGTFANASASGELATNWVMAGYNGTTVTGSKVDRNLRQGKLQRVAFGGNSDTGSGFIYQDVQGSKDGTTLFSVGDKVYGQIAIQFSDITEITKSIEFGIDCREVVGGTGTVKGQFYGLFHTSDAPDMKITPTGQLIIRTPEFTIPTSTTHLRFSLRVYAKSGYVDLDVCEIRKV